VSPILGDEMALTNLAMHLGTPRADALRHMAARTGVDELGSLVSLLVQSDRFGTSMSEALKTFAHSMREERSLHAQEAAEKMAVKLLVPMVLFIFPAVLIILVGPAAIRLWKAMSTY
jgi:tight adherence protein C